MSASENNSSSKEPVLLQNLPKPALQSIYHAVTGKTETMSDSLMGNVIINRNNIDELYLSIQDLLSVHKLECKPTTTIIVKYNNSKSVTYSSWERYKSLFTTNNDITSELIIKIECLLDIPGTVQPQRCVINISLDSSLPVLASDKLKNELAEDLSLFFFLRNDWRAGYISIDFVDFIIAKGIISTFKEWFDNLDKAPERKITKLFLKHQVLVRNCIRNSGIIGVAALIITTSFTHKGLDINLLARLIGICFIIYSLFSIFSNKIEESVFKTIISGMIHTILLISDRDNAEYKKIVEKVPSGPVIIIKSLSSLILNISLGIVSSYIYSYFTGK